jgi:predicted esterase YcpF (UPF0227 family)
MIFYIHGFNSLSTGSKKIEDFSKFLEQEVIPLDYNSCESYVENIFNMSMKIIEKSQKLFINNNKYEENIFIGTSLGGFYAANLASIFNGVAIMLNPAINPKETLEKYIGEQKNYTTGIVSKFTQEHVNSYINIRIPKNAYIILNAGDEVISSFDTIKKIDGKHKYIVFPGGTHRFEDVEEVSTYIKLYLDSL